MKFSVVICTFNRKHVLERTLPTLLRQEFCSADYEVVVVVDGSEDGTTGYLRTLAPRCALTILEQPNRGAAAARNAGFAAARGELVLVIDDDIVCSPDLLYWHLAAHQAVGGPAVVFGPVLVAKNSLATEATWWTEGYTDEYIHRLERDEQPRWPRDMVMEANYSAPRDTLLASGGYDSKFPSREGAELGLRLYARGLPFKFEWRARVWQLFVKTPGGVVHDAWHYGRSEVKLSRMYPDYRPHTMMARMSEGMWMTQARRVAVQWPTLAESVLRKVARGTFAHRRSAKSRSAAVRLLKLRQGVQMLRGASAESGSWEQVRREFGATLPVLIFHHVGPRDEAASPGLTMTGTTFARMIDWLARHGYSGISPSQWLRWVKTAEPLPSKPVLLTFDDAYSDLAEHAFPVLREYGFSAGVYVVTAEVGGRNSWDRGMAVWPCLDTAQIREWSRQGIEFGAHTRTHTDLTQLGTRELEAEVAGSRMDLEDILGQPVRTFAYPFGQVNDAAVECVRKHFDLAFTCAEGINSLATDLHLMRRTMALPSDFGLDLALRTRLGHSPLHTLKKRLRVRSRFRTLLGARV